MAGATDDDHAGKRFDVRDRLQYAMATISVLRSLALTDRTMQYGQLAQAIGLIPPTGAWKVWHRQQIAEILQIIAAVERQAGPNTGAARVEFERIVAKDGKPGAGVTRDTRIVSTPQPSVD